MLGVRIGLLIASMVALIVSRLICEYGASDDNLLDMIENLCDGYKSLSRRYQIISLIFAIIGFLLLIAFAVVLVITNWSFFTIPKILALIACSLYICFKEEWEPCFPFWIAWVITIICYIVTGIMWFGNLNTSAEPDIESTKTIIMCAKDNSNINGNMSGGIFYVSGSVEEDSVYRYYYKLEDGGMKQGQIPAKSTTIYYIEDNETPYLEEIITTEYWIDESKNPPERLFETSETTYELYVPEGSVTTVFEFNADY